jgi:hypothetical protein
MKYLALLIVILAVPSEAGATAAPNCASHWCMRLMGTSGSGYACMVGGEMGPNTCVATTSGCSRMACRYSVLFGAGGRLLALVSPRCGKQHDPLDVSGTPGIVARGFHPGFSAPAADRLHELESE